jgi:hypothetical protein
MKLSLGEETFGDPYHIPVIRTALTKNIPAKFPEMRDEIVQSFRDTLAVDDSGAIIYPFCVCNGSC